MGGAKHKNKPTVEQATICAFLLQRAIASASLWAIASVWVQAPSADGTEYLASQATAGGSTHRRVAGNVLVTRLTRLSRAATSLGACHIVQVGNVLPYRNLMIKEALGKSLEPLEESMT